MKRILIIIVALVALSTAQVFLPVSMSENQTTMSTDNSILNVENLNVDYSNPIITIPDGYEEMREASHVVEHDGKLIWVVTYVEKVNNINFYSLHRFECSVDDLENWEYKGKLLLLGQGGVELEGEDPSFYIAPDGRIHLMCEDKSYEKMYKMFVVSKYIAENWDSPFYFQGGTTGVSPGGDGRYKDAVYSSFYFRPEKLFLDGRKGRWEENVFYAEWKNERWVLDPEPLFSVEDISQPIKSQDDSRVLTTGIADAVHEVVDDNGNIVYVLEIVAYKDWSYTVWERAQPNVYNGYWSQGLAVSNSLRSGWEELNSEIKDQNGKNLQFNLFYSNGWKALIVESDNIYLAEIEIGSIPNPEPDPDNPFNLPDDVSGVSYNTVLMRELRPLVLGFTLPPEEEVNRDRVINLLDEVGVYKPFDKRIP